MEELFLRHLPYLPHDYSTTWSRFLAGLGRHAAVDDFENDATRDI